MPPWTHSVAPMSCHSEQFHDHRYRCKILYAFSSCLKRLRSTSVLRSAGCTIHGVKLSTTPANEVEELGGETAPFPMPRLANPAHFIQVTRAQRGYSGNDGIPGLNISGHGRGQFEAAN